MSTMPRALDPVALGRTAFAATVNEFARLWFAELAQLAADSTPREVDLSVADAAESVRVRGRPRGWGGSGAEPAGAEDVYRLLAGHVGDAGADVPAVLRTRAEILPLAEVIAVVPTEPDPEPAAPVVEDEPVPTARKPYLLACSLAACRRAFYGQINQKRKADANEPVYCCVSHAMKARWEKADGHQSEPLPTMEEMVADEVAEYAGSTE